MAKKTELQLAEMILGKVLEAYDLARDLGELGDNAMAIELAALMKKSRKVVADWRGRRGHEED